MLKKFALALVVGTLSTGGMVAVSSPVSAQVVPQALAPAIEPAGIAAWQQRRIDRADRWLAWADAQLASGAPAKAFQGYKRVVLELRGVDLVQAQARMDQSARRALELAVGQVGAAAPLARSPRDQQLFNQAAKLLDGCIGAIFGGGYLLGIEKCRLAFLRVSSIVPTGTSPIPG